MDKIKICNRHKLKNYVTKYKYCMNCGIISGDGILTLKSSNYYYKTEINPFDHFKSLNSNLKPIIKQPPKLYIDKRPTVIQNMKLITNQLKYHKKTFYLALYYLDFIFSCCIPDYKLELITVSCIILAAKFDEIDPCLPERSYFQTAYPNENFKKEELSKCEIFCIKTLKYTLNQTTSFNIIQFMQFNGFIFSDDSFNYKPLNESDRKTMTSSQSSLFANENLSTLNFDNVYSYLLDIHLKIIQDSRSLSQNILNLAFSCIAITREHFKLKIIWSSHLENLYNSNFQNIQEAFELCKKIINFEEFHSKTKIVTEIGKKFTQKFNSLYSQYQNKTKTKFTKPQNVISKELISTSRIDSSFVKRTETGNIEKNSKFKAKNNSDFKKKIHESKSISEIKKTIFHSKRQIKKSVNINQEKSLNFQNISLNKKHEIKSISKNKNKNDNIKRNNKLKVESVNSSRINTSNKNTSQSKIHNTSFIGAQEDSQVCYSKLKIRVNKEIFKDEKKHIKNSFLTKVNSKSKYFSNKSLMIIKSTINSSISNTSQIKVKDHQKTIKQIKNRETFPISNLKLKPLHSKLSIKREKSLL